MMIGATHLGDEASFVNYKQLLILRLAKKYVPLRKSF